MGHKPVLESVEAAEEVSLVPMTPTRQGIQQECKLLEELLLEKNARYGDSALSPLGIMSASDSPLEAIAVRIDDKLKRIQNMGGLQVVLTARAADAEDTVQDLLGYLVLARVCAKRYR